MNTFWNKWSKLLLKVWKLIAFGSIGLGLVLLLMQKPLTAQNQLDNNSGIEIGFEVEGRPDLNSFVIPVYKYTGECPGLQAGKIRAMFTSSTTPPNQGLRVVVTNISRGLLSDPFPYTDRAYNQGRASEATDVSFGTKHSQRYFAVLEGRNKFEYEIKKETTVLEKGKFTAEVRVNLIEAERNKVEKTQTSCNVQVGLFQTCPQEHQVTKTILVCQ